MTKKDKLLLSNIIFFLTVFIAVGMLLVKTSEHSQNISTISFLDIFTLLTPIILIIAIAGLLNITLGAVILYDPVFITFRKIVFVPQYKSLNKNQLNYPLNNHKLLSVLRC